jgi:hypothetical protein
MGFLDNLGKSISQGIDRAKFETDKFQRITRVQNEINELRKQADAKKVELADRTLDLYKAGQIQSAMIGELAKSIEALRSSIVLKEDELKTAQNETFVEPTPSSGVNAQNVPINVETPQPTAPKAATGTVPGTKVCPQCQFQMPNSAMFCPNCGSRVGV